MTSRDVAQFIIYPQLLRTYFILFKAVTYISRDCIITYDYAYFPLLDPDSTYSTVKLQLSQIKFSSYGVSLAWFNLIFIFMKMPDEITS